MNKIKCIGRSYKETNYVQNIVQVFFFKIDIYL